MEIILSLLLFISMIFNFVLLKYQPTVYVVQESKAELESEPAIDFSGIDLTSVTESESVEDMDIRAIKEQVSGVYPNKEYAPWKNEKGIQQTMPNSSSTHKPAPPLKPLERPYGFSR